MKKKEKAKVGRLILVDEGEYSDYSVIGIFIVIKEFIPDDEVEKYLNLFPEQAKDYCFISEKYIQYLISGGYIEEKEHDSLYLGSYSKPSYIGFSTNH